ncbi:MAG: AEC family transporter [Ruminococcaceae bacterium]|nr:AEC family transporter [Oscillospiraceae bacterium]
MFQTVFTQVVILFILIFIGFILNKTKILDEKSTKGITDIVLYLATPATIIKSFIRDFSPSLLKNLSVGFIAGVVAHIIFIALSLVLLRSRDASRQKVLQFSVIFSNCGYMSIPLLQAVLGDDGVFYGATYIAVFQIVIWSYGLFLMGDGVKSITPKKVIFSPGIIGFSIAFIIFVTQIPIPSIIREPINYMASLNTPLPMIVIGYHLANSNILNGLKDIRVLFAIIIKLCLFPVIAVFGFRLFGITGTMPLAITTCISAPTAALCTMFASKFERDTSLSVTLVSLSTLLSVISMPLIASLAEKFLN